jgi:hypothetical protein
VSYCGLALLFTAFCAGAQTPTADAAKPAAQSCTTADLDFDASMDVHAFEGYQLAIAALLKQEQFTELDCIADSARSSKARFSGGIWKLRSFYGGVSEPQPGHATEEDWQNHLQRIERWTMAKPHSITARIALAESYVNYAWNVRGDGFGGTVTDSGWKLFSQRMEKAQSILDEAAKMPEKCPHWYVAMQQVARGQSWGLDRATALFEKAASLEPGYYSFYGMQATLLLPKWEGQEGDAARFAEHAANRIGGKAGDIQYFRIASVIVCACEDPEFSHFSWPRLQQGFAALEQQYGPSLYDVNSFALMAYTVGDPVVADAAFKRIGDSWSKDVWKTEEWFKQNRDWAAQLAPSEIQNRAYKAEALANLQTAEGAAYKKSIDPKFDAFVQTCLQDSGQDMNKFQLLVMVNKDGVAGNGRNLTQTSVSHCVFQTMAATFSRKEKLFPPPPHDSYWVIFDVDPKSYNTASN